ncbi:PstS ABC-type phosphate transport system, periplasmic component [Candidatus Nanopelagicaceae bacterium]
MKFSRIAKVASATLAFAVIASTTPAHAADLQGSGASFPALLIEACKAGFAKDTSHSFTYAASGSGTGRSNSDKGIGDFWFTDAPHVAATKRSTIIHAPIVAAPIAVLANFPTVGKQTLQFSAATLAGIFGGTITKWNDPAIVADNNRAYVKIVYDTDKNGNLIKDKNGKPKVLLTQNRTQRMSLPNRDITVVYRSDSSGTSENFTNYLNKSAPTVWTKAKNTNFKDSFPGNINGSGNFGRIVGASSSSGVALQAGKTPYSITYAEVNYATANKLKVANVINPFGASVAPDSDGVSAFLSYATQDANGFLTFDYATKEKGAYPLGIVSYLLADTKYPDKAKAKAVKELANYVLGSKCAATVGADLGFSLITGSLLTKAQAQVAKIG